ncbi:hypothetical protein AURDEDRAFT_159310 [Auricularia subglabra TFB-10046 SS5]|nr:hypothetical protein AURDEDRAFT_159310 [Auricularia subglabra TFB-10046 SS5]
MDIVFVVRHRRRKYKAPSPYPLPSRNLRHRAKFQFFDSSRSGLGPVRDINTGNGAISSPMARSLPSPRAFVPSTPTSPEGEAVPSGAPALKQR